MSDQITYPSIGRCIYCGISDPSLTDAHIIPYALAGTWIFRDASCTSCNKITHRFEGVVARQIFGKFRAKHNLPTRRPKERPTHFTVGTSSGPRVVSASEHPSELFIYKFHPPNVLFGLPPTVDVPNWVPIAVYSRDELNAFTKTHNWDQQIRVQMRALEYAQMLAKIGHSYAVTVMGYGEFSPLAVDLILGRTKNISHAVGGSWDDVPADPTKQHSAQIQVVFDAGLRRNFVVVEIRLFAQLGTPIYQVVVGEISDLRRARQLVEKLGTPVIEVFSQPLPNPLLKLGP